MQIIKRISLFTLMIGLVLGCTPFAPKMGNIKGEVIDASNGNPIAEATVKLIPQDIENRQDTTTDEGKFELTSVSSDGSWLLEVSKTGYITSYIDKATELLGL